MIPEEKAPLQPPEEGDSHPRHIAQWIPGSWLDEPVDVDSISRLTTLPLSPGVADAVAVLDSIIFWDCDSTTI